ncbi:MAG: shikimate dehydrogenase [Myxococcales bacterium]|nr:shikimate dehydrogenase [Myxococcales bacterium]
MSDRVFHPSPAAASASEPGARAGGSPATTGAHPEAAGATSAHRARPVTLCGSIARLAGPVGRALHEAGYRALGLPFAYVPFAVEPARLGDAIRGMRALGIRGLGVSQPFKETVIALLDDLDPVARRIGAVNTIVNGDGTLVGHNTDWMGATRALEEVRPVSGARVLLVGAGGAARAIAFGLREKGARTAITNRDAARAERLAAEAGAQPVPWAETRSAARYDVVINATSAGQRSSEGERQSEASVVPESALAPGLVVFDIVYKPFETPLVRAARRRGATAIHGGRMLLFQAAAQFELYTGSPAPLPDMERALLEAADAIDATGLAGATDTAGDARPAATKVL